MPLYLDLLGGLSLRTQDGQAIALPRRKAEALLAYLASPAGRFHGREKLTGLLWGNHPEDQARHSFRQALSSLRLALAECGSATLVAQGDAVALDPGEITVDVMGFEADLRDGRPPALARAMDRYRGGLLEGFSVAEDAFEEWRTCERERLHVLALQSFNRLLQGQFDAGELDAAALTALRILELDPLQEAVHRTLMRVFRRQGRRAAALQQYQRCVASLRRELGTEPEEETRKLYRTLLRTAAAGAAGATPAVLRRGDAGTLVGRAAEMDVIRRAVADLFDRGGRTLLIRGEAGIGKSRLLAELADMAQATGAAVALGQCHEAERALPLHPWIDALRGGQLTLDPALRDLLTKGSSAQLVRVFPELRQSGEQPVTTIEQHTVLFESLIELIRQLATDRPMVLMIEDLHWADALSARFFAFLGRRVDQLPLLLVGTMRPEDLIDAPAVAEAVEDLGSTTAVKVELGPLDQEQSGELVGSLGGGPDAKDLAESTAAIWATSRGNPFVIVEMVRERQLGHLAEPRGRLASRIEDAVGRRLDRLASSTRHAVAVAAAIGREFSFALLKHAAQMTDQGAATAVEELVRRRIFAAVGDRLDFEHDWIRRVTYDRLVPAVRVAVHGAVAAALESVYADRIDEVADQIGEQYSRAGDSPRAVTYLVRFSAIAVQRYALDDALAALAQATVIAGRLPAAERDRWHLDITLRETFVLSLLGRQPEIFTRLSSRVRLLDRVSDPALTSDYGTRLALVHWYRGEHGEAQAAAERALREGQRAESPERIGRAEYALALNGVGLGRLEEGAAHAERAIDILDTRQTRHWRGLAYFALGLNLVVAGRLDGAAEAGERCAAIGRAEGDPRLESGGGYIVAWVCLHRGETERAIARARQTLESSRDAVAVNLASGILGWAHLESGDLEAAIPLLERSAERFRSMPLRLTEGRFLSVLSEAYLRAGDVDRATECAERALEMGQRDGNPLTRGLAERALGRIAGRRGASGEANGRFESALTILSEAGAGIEAAQTHLDLSGAAAALGRPEAEREHLEAAAALLGRAGAPERAGAIWRLFEKSKSR